MIIEGFTKYERASAVTLSSIDVLDLLHRAGYPLAEYFRRHGDKVAASLRFAARFIGRVNEAMGGEWSASLEPETGIRARFSATTRSPIWRPRCGSSWAAGGGPRAGRRSKP